MKTQMLVPLHTYPMPDENGIALHAAIPHCQQAVYVISPCSKNGTTQPTFNPAKDYPTEAYQVFRGEQRCVKCDDFAGHRVQTAKLKTPTGLGEPSYSMINDVASYDGW